MRNGILLLTLGVTLAFAGAPVNVTTAETSLLPVTEEVNTFGTLVAVNQAMISSEVSGKVSTIFFKDGQTVHENNLILQLDSTQVKAALLSAQADLLLAQRNLQRYVELNKYGGTTKQELDNARATVNAKEAIVQSNINLLQKYTLTAPFTGQLGSFKINSGDYVSAGEPLVSLVNNQPIKVEYALPENTYAQLHLGQVAKVDVDALPRQVFTGKVTYIAPAIDPKSGTVSVQSTLDNHRGLLSPGMFVHIRQIFNEKKVLVVPEEAVLASPEGPYVFKVKDQHAEKTFVKVQGYLQGFAEIESPLVLHDEIVVEGQQKLSGGETLNIVGHSTPTQNLYAHRTITR